LRLKKNDMDRTKKVDQYFENNQKLKEFIKVEDLDFMKFFQFYSETDQWGLCKFKFKDGKIEINGSHTEIFAFRDELESMLFNFKKDSLSIEVDSKSLKRIKQKFKNEKSNSVVMEPTFIDEDKKSTKKIIKIDLFCLDSESALEAKEKLKKLEDFCTQTVKIPINLQTKIQNQVDKMKLNLEDDYEIIYSNKTQLVFINGFDKNVVELLTETLQNFIEGKTNISKKIDSIDSLFFHFLKEDLEYQKLSNSSKQNKVYIQKIIQRNEITGLEIKGSDEKGIEFVASNLERIIKKLKEKIKSISHPFSHEFAWLLQAKKLTREKDQIEKSRNVKITRENEIILLAYSFIGDCSVKLQYGELEKFRTCCINFVPLDYSSNECDSLLKLAGEEVKEEFEKIILKNTSAKVGDIFETSRGDLKCQRLVRNIY
jgi:hypothetical protein